MKQAMTATVYMIIFQQQIEIVNYKICVQSTWLHAIFIILFYLSVD